LDELCHENIVLLQKSMPVKPAGGSKSVSSFQAVDSLAWGLAPLQMENSQDEQHLSMLIRHVQSVLGSDILPKRGKSKKAKATGPEVPAPDWNEPALISNWLTKQLPVRSNEPGVALVSSGWIHGLPQLGRQLEPGIWLDTLQTVLTQVDRAWVIDEPESLLSWLIWTCDIPLALANQLSQLGSKDRVVCDTLDRLALALEQAEQVSQPWLEDGCRPLRSLLSCVVRCRWTADRLGAREWFAPQRKSLASLAAMAVSATDRQGRPLLVDSRLGKADPELWKAILRVCKGARGIDHLMHACLPGIPKSTRRPRSNKSLTAAPLGLYNEAAEVAFFRRSWDSHGARVAIDFSTDPMWLDVIGCAGQRLMSGLWEVRVKKNDRPLELQFGWTEVCWFSDDEVDYLELQCEIEEQCVLQRQIMLIRDEGLLFVADALNGIESAQWSIESRYPMEDRVQFEQDAKTRDGVILIDREDRIEPQALVLPIGLPEWKRQVAQGDVQEEGDSLVVSQSGEGKHLYAPLVVSLLRKNQTQALTWRHLTVAEDLRKIGPEDAVAYRVQIGKSQWVIYRSLSPTRRRTAMGLHLNVEFFAGRFDGRDGQFDALVEVDAESA
jgi:hypothetical protein